MARYKRGKRGKRDKHGDGGLTSRIDVLKYASGRGDSIIRPPVKSRIHLGPWASYEATN